MGFNRVRGKVINHYPNTGTMLLQDAHIKVGDICLVGGDDSVGDGEQQIFYKFQQTGTPENNYVADNLREDAARKSQDNVYDGVNTFNDFTYFPASSHVIYNGVNIFQSGTTTINNTHTLTTIPGLDFVHEGEPVSTFSTLKASSTGTPIWDTKEIAVEDSTMTWTGFHTFSAPVRINAPLTMGAPIYMGVLPIFTDTILWNSGSDAMTVVSNPYGGLVTGIGGTRGLNAFDLSNSNTVGTESDQGASRLGIEAMMTRRGIDDNLLTSVVGGSGITIDNTDSRNPIISTSGGPGGGSDQDNIALIHNYGSVAGTVANFYLFCPDNTNGNNGATCVITGGGQLTNQLCPIQLTEDSTLNRIFIHSASMAVSTGTVSSPSVVLGLYEVEQSVTTLVQNIVVPVDNPADVKIFNDLSGTANPVTAQINGLGITLTAGKKYGILFLNTTADDRIGGIYETTITLGK